MSNRWNEIPFTYHFINLTISNCTNKLPFVVGGATQQGTTHIFDNSNNQDAVSLFLSDNLIIGIVCDGCTSTHDEIRNSYSNNEIGSKLISFNLSNIIQNYLSENKIYDNGFLENIETSLLQRLATIIDLQLANDEKAKEIFIYDYLMTTILCFIITEKDFIVFSCGDGIIGINDNIQSLMENGTYLSSLLLPKCCPSAYVNSEPPSGFVINYKGNTSELQYILLATDGFTELIDKFQTKLKNFIFNSTIKAKDGYDFILPEFRKNILKDEDISKYSTLTNWPKDDASFLLLRRVSQDDRLVSSENINKGIEDDTINSN